MGNINDEFPSNYLKASDLRGNAVTVQIDHVAFEEVGRQKERKAVVYFKGKDKGLILNKTNANKIQQIATSPMTEDWEGVRVTLYPTETEFGGETIECIRIKPAPATAMARGQASRPASTRPPDPEPEPEAVGVGAGTLDDSDIPF